MNDQRFQWPVAGAAKKENIVVGDTYRFTVLTDRLIRIEQSDNGTFEDRATQKVIYRDFDRNDYTVTKDNGILTIETASLVLTYHENEPFDENSLQIRLKSYPASVWKFGVEAEQLGGTVSTLDQTDGEVQLEGGVCARIGYAVIDDSGSMIVDDGWFAVRDKQPDIYFFGYGHNYLDAVKDLYRLTGIPPLLPDYALGNWWSRYHAYTQEEYKNLICRFEKEDVPFSVSVVDMDWHWVADTPDEAAIDHPKYRRGWTGYSWNTKLFPDYKGFLKFLKEHNLKTSLNLHPACGIGPHEDMYEQMATACGYDPAERKVVKFDCLNPEFMKNYFDILHHPYEEDGVDFWWMDWQQGKDYWWVHDEDHPASELEQMDPLWILNHLHILDINRNGKRPMFFSRYSGVGSQRYPVGFSGDTVVAWKALDFQPYFTATASNVGYSWWSHDIGGHMFGYRDDDLYVRWLWLGVFSPINRLHSSNNDFLGKEPWNYTKRSEIISKDLLRLRHRLFPYIYTMNYRNHTELEPLVQPMYYTHPESAAAYDVRNQYWFGSEFFVAPITQKDDAKSMLAQTTAWFPKGKWFDVYNGYCYEGDQKMKVHRPLEQMPIFAKAGAIIPLEEYTHDNKMGKKDSHTLYVFPGADNHFVMYEDEGDGSEYQNGVFATTAFDLSWGKEAKFTINPASGKTDLLPGKRNWTVKFRGFADNAVKVSVDGKEMRCDTTFDADTATITVFVPEIDIDSKIEVVISGEMLIADNSRAYRKAYDILLKSQTAYDWKILIWNSIEKNQMLFKYDDEQVSIIDAVNEMLSLCGRKFRRRSEQ